MTASSLRQALQEMIRDLLVSTNSQAALAKEAQRRGLLGALTHEIPLEVGDKPLRATALCRGAACAC